MGEKPSAIIQASGGEGTIFLQSHLCQKFDLVDTRGFFNYDGSETKELLDIVQGRLKDGQRLRRRNVTGAQVNAAAIETDCAKLPEEPLADRVHGVIVVVKATDPALKAGVHPLSEQLAQARGWLKGQGMEPVTVVTHYDELKTDAEREHARQLASAATGSPPDMTLFIANYTADKKAVDYEKEAQAITILELALERAERAVKLFKQRKQNAARAQARGPAGAAGPGAAAGGPAPAAAAGAAAAGAGGAAGAAPAAGQ